MLPKVYVYKCPDCGHQFEALVDYDSREHTACIQCGSVANRTWSGWTMNVSTRNSASMPAATASGRFDSLKEKQKLIKEKSEARVSGDRETEKKISKEMKKL